MKVITHNDYDGLISSLFFKKFVNPNIEIEGFYENCNTFSTVNPFNLEENYYGIDIDQNLFKGIGHHLQIGSLCNANDLNPNLYFGINGPEQIFEKCPFSTVMLIILTNENAKKYFLSLFENKDYKKIACILYADNFYPYIFERYLQNTRKWFERYKADDVFIQIANLKSHSIIPYMKLIESTKMKGEKKNEFLFSQRTDSLSGLLDFLSNIFNEVLELREMNYKKRFNSYSSFITSDLIEKLEKLAANGRLISHAVVNRKEIRWTISGF